MTELSRTKTFVIRDANKRPFGQMLESNLRFLRLLTGRNAYFLLKTFHSRGQFDLLIKGMLRQME
jgi:hypothetical protein